MASNVYTKNEILQTLASKGFFVDAYTLDTFFAKWKVEAIFEDEQGSEFYDKNALDLVLNNLFNSQEEEKKEEEVEVEPRLIQPKPTEANPTYIQQSYTMEQPVVKQGSVQMNMNQPIQDVEVNNLLGGISLSDGTLLTEKIQNPIEDLEIDYQQLEQEAIANIQNNQPSIFEVEAPKEKKMGILEGAMLATGQEFEPEPSEAAANDEGSDFDDISLLSESYEAQEKFREYVVSELSKKNVDLTPKNNEFKLDISERTLNMVARSLAKKVVKHVSQLYGGDPKTSEKLVQTQELNKKLETRAKELEDQNKKLRLLLAESNKNLNSYKPSFFGLYKKVPPGQ